MLNSRVVRHNGTSKVSRSDPSDAHRILVCDSSQLAIELLDGTNIPNLSTTEISDASMLLHAVSALSPDLVVLSKQMLENILKRARCEPETEGDLESALADLTERQAEVVQLLSKGLRNQEIATTLGLSSRTIKAILSGLYIRYEVTNRTELLGRLVEEGHTLASQPSRANASGRSKALPTPRTSNPYKPRLGFAT